MLTGVQNLHDGNTTPINIAPPMLTGVVIGIVAFAACKAS